MASYADWEQRDISVFALKLDPLNPRLGEDDADLSQNEIINILLDKKFKILELAESIARIGFTPLDNIIAFEDAKSGEYMVLEGNRRVAALKLLLNPKLVRDEKMSKRFQGLSEALSSEIKKELSEVQVVIAPSRSSADRVLLLRHTSKVIEKWTPAMQAKFTYEKSKEYGFDRTQNELGVQRDELEKSITAYHFTRLAEAILGLEYDHKKFPLSTLERVLGGPEAREYLGISFSDDGELHFASDREGFLNAFGDLVNLIHQGTINSRNVNTTADALKWLKKFSKPATAAKQVFEKLYATKPSKKPKAPRGGPVDPPFKPQTKFLPKDVECEDAHSRLNKIVSELKSISMVTNPNAVAVLARTFIEVACAQYLKHMNLVGKYDEYVAKGNHIDGLSAVLGFLADKQNKALPSKLATTVGQFKNKDNFASLKTIHNFVHNENSSPTASDLRDFWTTIESFIRHILKRD